MTLAQTGTDYVREFHDEVCWKDRLVAIVGPRGVGKTTLVLQHIKLHENPDECLFAYADDLWFSAHSLYSLAEDFYKNGGKALYIDEIHKYRNWSQEIKNIYDSFPTLRVCYTGSSVLDLQKGSHDLSRRLLEYHLEGLSFREYLAIAHGINIPRHSLEQIFGGKIDFPYQDWRPLPLFKEYLREGYYPYFKEGNYPLRLSGVINTVLEDDIPKFAALSLSTAQKLKTLLYIIAQSVPFKPNYSKIGRDLDLNRNAVADLVVSLEKAGLINILRDEVEGISLLGKVNKIYLNNPNLSYELSENTPEIGNIRETIFLSWMKGRYRVTASQYSDFKVGKYTFEVGGKNKARRQIAALDNAYIVKDDIEYAAGNTVPLFAFGLLY